MSVQSELWEIDPSEMDETDLGEVQTNAVVTATDWTVETILSQLKRGNIELSPRFQRREAWVDSRKAMFIESLFLGLPIPQIVLAERRDKRGSYIVIDGKQRLLSIRRFGVVDPDEGFTPLTLSGLKNKKNLNGHTWTSLKDAPQFEEDTGAYENQTIRTVVVRNWPDDSFLYLVFLRLNTGSVPLSPQELRQALHPGPFVDYAEEHSSESQPIKKALGLSSPDFRMRDVEKLIRFMAFVDSIQTYNGNLKDFLDNLCESFNKNWDAREQEIRGLAEECDQAIETTIDIFESSAFQRWRNPNGFENRFNRAVFDIMTYYFRHAEIGELASKNREKVVAGFKDLCATDDLFNEALQSTTKSISATFHRLRRWGETLQTILACEVNIPEAPTAGRRSKATRCHTQGGIVNYVPEFESFETTCCQRRSIPQECIPSVSLTEHAGSVC